MDNGHTLEYIECPNCKSAFNEISKFKRNKNFIGINQFTCLSCNREFNYPTTKNYVLDLILGIVFFMLSLAIPTIPWDIIVLSGIAILGIIGFGLILQGIVGASQNSSLKNTNSGWENRLHNTWFVFYKSRQYGTSRW